MVGNGAYMMEAPRTDEEIVIVKNPDWKGDLDGETWDDRLDRIVFRVFSDPDTAYNAFEAGECDTANIPPARALEARDNWGTTLDLEVLGSYHWFFNQRDERIGGEENKLLRQAISQAIDREFMNEAVYNGTRTVSTGITPPGIPGFQADMCDYCSYDPEAAQAAFDEWTAAGNSIDEPLPIQFNAGAGHEDVAAIIVDNLAAIGIDSVATPMPTEDYFSQLAEGACVICRAGWFADYPTYDNFMYDLFHARFDRRQQPRLRRRGVRCARGRGQADGRSGRAGGPLPAGGEALAQRRDRRGAVELVPRRLRVQRWDHQ